MQDPIHSLFNDKTIHRLCSDIDISKSQKASAKQWLEWLKSDSLSNEEKNYLRFANYILDDILNYPVKKDLDFENSNVEFSFRNYANNKGVCIEAKGTTVKDLFAPQRREKQEHKTPIKQTWDYMGKGNFDYGIATNYRHFILIDKSKGYSKYHFFDFLEIDKDQNKLKEFIAIFSRRKILEDNFVSKLYEESVLEEREFTKQFYKLFHETRLMLIKEFIENKTSEEDAIHYAQLFLNRIIFIFFAEDNNKLQKRLFHDITIQSLQPLLISENSNYVSETIKNLFTRLDKGSNKPVEIFGFNGGLFKESFPYYTHFKDLRDENFFKDVLQYSNLKKITLDELTQKRLQYYNNLNPIIKNLLLMDSFNFKTELNVNILGHIFEQSLTDIEDLSLNLKDALEPKQISTRKKEGIYYTPEYITDFICKNTIIPYLSKNGTNSIEDLINEYKDNIEELETRFSSIKILDPSCGSGAFLIKAIEVLFDIYKQIQYHKELEGKYYVIKKGKRKNTFGEYTLTKWQEEEIIGYIIENNIYGVDINEESVEITKLGLFLKIASGHRKLIELSKNIKIGNSLIEDNSIIDKKPFSWNNEFDEIIKGGGFDIVIGNPPYVRQEQITSIKPYLKEKYIVYSGVADLYVYFFEKGINLLKENGIFTIIVSNKFTKAGYAKKLREFLLDFNIRFFLDFGDLPVFKDATTYPCIISIQKNNLNKKFFTSKIENLHIYSLDNDLKKNSISIERSSLSSDEWNFDEASHKEILSKIKKISKPLGEIISNQFYRGITTGYNAAFVITEKEKEEIIESDIKSSEIIFPYLSGKEIKRYQINWDKKYIIFTRRGIDISQYHGALRHLNKFKKQLMPKESEKDKKQLMPKESEKDKIGRKPGNYKWYEIQDSTEYWRLFFKPAIIYPHFNRYSNFTFSEGNYFPNAKVYVIDSIDKFLLGILNSKLMNFYIKSICPYVRGGYYEYGSQYIKKLPISTNKNFENDVVDKVNSILKINNNINKIKNNVINRILYNLKVLINQKLENFYELSFTDFLNEIKKQGKILSLIEQDQWESYFRKKSQLVKELLYNVKKKEQEVDILVFKSYNLNDNEIKIVEKHMNNFSNNKIQAMTI